MKYGIEDCDLGKNGKPLLGVLGFLGRGNAGDEALVQGIYESFCDDFDIVLVVDEYGAYPGFWDWYPYNSAQIVHVGNIHFFEKKMAGLIIGGGGLGLGYGAAQALIAGYYSVPVVLAGVDYNHDAGTKLNTKKYKEYLSLFDDIYFRSSGSVENAKKIGIDSKLGADWAVDLPVDNSQIFFENEKRILLTIRELDLSEKDMAEYSAQIKGALRILNAAGYLVEWMPFSPEDVKFIEKLELNESCKLNGFWSNARRIKELISKSGAVVSVGRLHPLVFASSINVPCCYIQPPLGRCVDFKIKEMSGELGYKCLNNFEDFFEDLNKNGLNTFATPDEKSCLDNKKSMVSSMRDIFLRKKMND